MPITAIPLVPKDANRELNVIAMGRISTVHQDVENIEASYRYTARGLGCRLKRPGWLPRIVTH
jgi:hypothetical protein